MRKYIKLIAAAILMGSMCALPCVTPVTSIEAYAKTAFDAPTDTYWGDKKGEDEGYYAHWDEVENAKKYEVYLYYINDNDGYTKVGSATTSNNYINLKTKFTKTADYVFRVRAMETGTYARSSWSDYSDEAYYEKTTSTNSSGSSSSSNSGTSGMNGGPGTSVSLAGWRQDSHGWWYATNSSGTAWYANCWKWIDGRCYCFDASGYMYANTTTPDGYTVNSDGQWIVNGTVQVQ